MRPFALVLAPLALVLAALAPAAPAQSVLGNGEVVVVTTAGVYALPPGLGVDATRVASPPAFAGGLENPSIAWLRGTDDMLVASGSRLYRVTLTALFVQDSAVVQDVTPAFPAPADVQLRDIEVDPARDQVWLLDRLNARAFRLDALAAGQAPALTVDIGANVRCLTIDTHRAPFSLVYGRGDAVVRQALDGTVDTLTLLSTSSAVSVDPTVNGAPFMARAGDDTIVRGTSSPQGTTMVNASQFCLPVVYSPQDIEWDPITNRLWALGEDGVNPCQFPITGPNVNHVVRLPITIGLGFAQPQLVTRPTGSDIDGTDGDLAVANRDYGFSAPYGTPGCQLLSGEYLELRERSSEGPPVLGNAGYEMQLRNAPPGAAGWLVAGLAETAVTVGGCQLLVDNPLLIALGPANANGTTGIPLPIPNAAALSGVQLYLQGRTVDVNGKGRLSNGLIVHLGE